MGWGGGGQPAHPPRDERQVAGRHEPVESVGGIAAGHAGMVALATVQPSEHALTQNSP